MLKRKLSLEQTWRKCMKMWKEMIEKLWKPGMDGCDLKYAYFRNHPEMPKEKPLFNLCVIGKAEWSWADIQPNWTFTEENPPQVNPFNEISRDLHKTTGEQL